MSRRIRIALSLVIGLVACQYIQPADKVGDLLRTPEKYEGHSVTVEGVVVETVSAFGYGLYRINDRTGSIWVRTDNVPAERTQIKLEGIMQVGVSVLGMDIGWHLKEVGRLQ